jgi:type II secretory pathway pseudopilin PulG
MWLAAGGPSADSVVSAGSGVVIAIVAGGTSLITSFFQNRSHKADQKTAAEEFQRQAEELRDRMALNYESQISYLKDELRRAQGRRRAKEGADDH